MAEPFVAELSRGELGEIPAYVVRPAESFESRYPTASIFAAPLRDLRDFKRPSFGQRVGVLLGRPSTVSIRSIVPMADVAGPADTIGAIRYEAIVVPAPATRKLHPGVWGLALVLAAFPVAGFATRHFQAARPAIAVAVLPAAPAAQPVAKPAAQPASKAVVAAPGPSAVKAPALQAAPVPAVLGPVHVPAAAGASTADPARSALQVAPAHPAKRTGDFRYTVVRGDSFSGLGRKFGLTPRTVRLASGLPLGARMRIGQVVVLPRENGAYHRIKAGETLGVLAKRYGVSEAKLRSHNPGLRPTHLRLDQRVFIPGATQLLRAEAQMVAPRGYRRGLVSKGVRQRLEASRSLIGQFGNRVGGLIWPARGQFSSPFGVRGAHFHPGVDICNYVGTPIHAAKAGRVKAAGWSSGYGYAVDIDHGGGVVTRYGHCSRLLVSAGQEVAQGEEIAKMGSTGYSTGPHVHFEVRIGGRAVNPSSFF